MSRFPARVRGHRTNRFTPQHNHDSQGLPVLPILVPWQSKVKVRELSWSHGKEGFKTLYARGAHVNYSTHLQPAPAEQRRGRSSIATLCLDCRFAVGRHGFCCPVRGAGRLHALRCHRCTSQCVPQVVSGPFVAAVVQRWGGRHRCVVAGARLMGQCRDCACCVLSHQPTVLLLLQGKVFKGLSVGGRSLGATARADTACLCRSLGAQLPAPPISCQSRVLKLLLTLCGCLRLMW